MLCKVDKGNKKYVLWNVNLPNAVAFNRPLSKYLTVTVMTLIQESSGSKVMVPIDSPWVVSYSTSIDPIVVSVTVFEIFDIHRSNGED